MGTLRFPPIAGQKGALMPLRIRVWLTVVTVFLGTAIVASPQSITVTGYETRVTSDPGDQYDPSISGNLVVFTDYRSADTDVYYVDLATMTEHPVIVGPGNQELTGISNGRIVYTDYRSSDVVLLDTADGTTQNLTAPDKAAVGHPFNSVDPVISGDLVAWEDSRDGNMEIYAMNVGTGEERRITDSPAVDSKPSMSGAVIAWQRCAAGGTCDIWSYDWSTGLTTQITDTPACNERNPSISGQKIVYQSDCLGDSDIDQHDLATGTQEHLALPGDQANPHVSGNFVSYDDLSEGLYHIGLWHPQTGGHFQLTSGTSGQYLNGIDGNRVVYTDDRNGDLEIYMYTFEAEGTDTVPPVISGATGVTVDATSPAGAHVVLNVKAIDDIDPSPKLTCTSPLDAVFPIGTTKVTCTATDASGNKAEPTAFDVNVRGAAEQLASLTDLVESLNLRRCIDNSLDAKLSAALYALEAARAGAGGSACRLLDAFMHEVNAQTGKAITASDAALLLNAAAQIRSVLGCPACHVRQWAPPRGGWGAPGEAPTGHRCRPARPRRASS
jgi:beta propeller repeat protein